MIQCCLFTMFKHSPQGSITVFNRRMCVLIISLCVLTLIRVFWDHHRACFLEKKSRIIAGDVTVGLSYDTNFKWHMPI